MALETIVKFIILLVVLIIIIIFISRQIPEGNKNLNNIGDQSIEDAKKGIGFSSNGIININKNKIINIFNLILYDNF